MGWWSIDDTEDLMGDGPADEIGVLLDDLAHERSAEGAPKPTLAELLRAIAEVLRSDGPEIIEDASQLQLSRLKGIVAQSAKGDVTGSLDEFADPVLAGALHSAFERVGREYKTLPEPRLPRLRELLAAVSFVLRPHPDRYLSDASGFELKDIVADFGR